MNPGGHSDPCIPRIAVVLVEAALATMDVTEAFNQLDALEILRHLVPQLAAETQPQRRAVRDWQRLVVHSVGEDSLGMPRLGEIYAFVIGLGGATDRVVAEEH